MKRAAKAGAWFDGQGLIFRVSSLSIPSHSRIRNLSLLALPSTKDQVPILLDGTAAPVSDVVIVDAVVDGNRVNQTQLLGDGRRHGIALVGRASGVRLIHPVVRRAATDCIRLEMESASPGGDADYHFIDIVIQDPDLQWCGRWGGSSMSVRGLTVTGAVLKNNGKPMPTFPKAPYASGGNARTFNRALDGPLYGGGWDEEDEGLTGGGFDGVALEVVDGHGNSGAAVSVGSDTTPDAPGFVTRKNLAIRVSGDVANIAAGLSPVIVSQGVYSGALKTYENVRVVADVSDNAMIFSGVRGLRVSGRNRLAARNPRQNAVVMVNVASEKVQVESDTKAAIPVVTVPAAQPHP